MKAETKRKYKRNYKIYKIIAWSMIVLIALGFLLTMLFSKLMSEILMIIIMVFLLAFMITGIVTNFVSDMYRRDLIRYKNNIREYRILRNYCNALRLLESKDLKSAVGIYNKHIPDKHKCKELLYISLIHEFKYSDEQDNKEKGDIKYLNLIADNDPNNIYLFE